MDPEHVVDNERVIFLPHRHRSQQFNILPVLLSSTVNRWRTTRRIDLVRGGAAAHNGCGHARTRRRPADGLGRYEGASGCGAVYAASIASRASLEPTPGRDR